MRWLKAGRYPKRTKAGNVGWINQLDMLDPMAAVAWTIGPACSLIAINGAAHSPVANRMHSDLKPATIDLDSRAT